MKKLAIKIKFPFGKIVQLNKPELLKTVREDLERWTVQLKVLVLLWWAVLVLSYDDPIVTKNYLFFW